MERVTDFIFLGSKTHGIKRRLLLGRKAMINLDSVLKSRDITLPTKVCIVKATVFPVVKYEWKLGHREGWKLKNWCFWIVVLQKTLYRVLWTARRSNQSILKDTNPEYSLGVLMLKLKLQYFGNLMWRANSLEKTWCWERLKAGGEGGDRGWDGWMGSLTQWTWAWANSRR